VTPNSSKFSGDSFDRDEVFFKDSIGHEYQVNSFPEPHPSPRVRAKHNIVKLSFYPFYVSTMHFALYVLFHSQAPCAQFSIH
jgi:hypothetical protein